MEHFEKDVMNIVKNFELRKGKTSSKIIKRCKKDQCIANILVFADKTSKIYEQKPEEHRKILMENTTKTYRKAPKDLEHEINLEAKKIAENLELDDCINCLAKTQAFIPMEDHKEDFRTNPTCRLINPTKVSSEK